MILTKFLSLFGVDVCLDQALLFLTIEAPYRSTTVNTHSGDRRGVCRIVVYHAPSWQARHSVARWCG
jgi:hypothetical protein